MDKLYIRASTLANVSYLGESWMGEDDFARSIRGEVKVNDKMKVGTAIHKMIEDPNLTPQPGPYVVKGAALEWCRRAHEKYGQNGAFELANEKSLGEYLGFELVITGHADVITPEYGIDWKVTHRYPDLEKYNQYQGSLQGYTYMWLFEVPEWRFVMLMPSFSNAEYVNGKPTVSALKYLTHVVQYRTMKTDAEIMRAATHLVDFALKNDLISHLTKPQCSI